MAEITNATYEWVDNLPVQLDNPATNIQSDTQQSSSAVQPFYHFIFSKADIQQLIDLWEADTTVRDIALAMGRPYNNIRNKVAQLQKNGVIMPRDSRNQLPDNYIETTAGAYGVPLEVVRAFTKMFSNGARKIMDGTEDALKAYQNQSGECFYLKGMVKLTFDETPSGVVPMYTRDGSMILVCKAVSGMRMSMSHEAFIGVCKHIANRF